MNDQMFVARQGDVLIVECDPSEVPTDGKPVARDNGRIVLAYGEVTGHAHAITAPRIKMIEATNGDRFLNAETGFVIQHEEHGVIKAPAGTFKVIYQREYSPEEIRRVID